MNCVSFQVCSSSQVRTGRGYITPEIAGKWPGYLDPTTGLKFSDVPNGLAAISKVSACLDLRTQFDSLEPTL